MRHDQKRKTGTNAKEKGGTRRQKLVKADQRGKDQKGLEIDKRRQDIIWRMGNTREIRSLTVGQMRRPGCGKR